MAQVVWEGDVEPESVLPCRLESPALPLISMHGTGNGDLAVLGSGGRFVNGRMAATGINGFSFSADNNTLFGQRFDNTNTQISLGSRYANLFGATFTGAARGIEPVAGADFVTLDYFNMHSGTGPVTAHDLIVGWSDDDTITDEEIWLCRCHIGHEYNHHP